MKTQRTKCISVAKFTTIFHRSIHFWMCSNVLRAKRKPVPFIWQNKNILSRCTRSSSVFVSFWNWWMCLKNAIEKVVWDKEKGKHVFILCIWANNKHSAKNNTFIYFDSFNFKIYWSVFDGVSVLQPTHVFQIALNANNYIQTFCWIIVLLFAIESSMTMLLFLCLNFEREISELTPFIRWYKFTKLKLVQQNATTP